MEIIEENVSKPVISSYITWLKDDPGYLGTPAGSKSMFWLISNFRGKQDTRSSCSGAAATIALCAVWELAVPWEGDERRNPREREVIWAGDSKNFKWWPRTRPEPGYPAGMRMQELFACMNKAADYFDIPAHTEMILAESEGFDQTARLCFEKSDRRECVIILHYNQSLVMKGRPDHYALMGAYDRDNDQLLILEIDSTGIGHHWIPVQILLDDMKKIDPATGCSRGIIVLHPEKRT